MAKKKVVEPPVDQPKAEKAELIKQLLAQREMSSAQDQVFIDREIMGIEPEE